MQLGGWKCWLSVFLRYVLHKRVRQETKILPVPTFVDKIPSTELVAIFWTPSPRLNFLPADEDEENFMTKMMLAHGNK